MGFFQKPFGYEPILTQDDVKQAVKKKKGHSCGRLEKYTVTFMENC